MSSQQDPVARLVACQHRRLDSMLAEVQGLLDDGEDTAAAHKAFARLRAAVESHMTEEDRLYVPAVERLAGAPRSAVVRLLDAHAAFRQRFVEIEAELSTATREQMQHLVGALTASFQAHEEDEERLFATLGPAVAPR